MKSWKAWKPIILMLVVNVGLAVLNTLIKRSIDEGMNRLVLITLRQFVAAAFLAPIAYFYERGSRPKMTTEIFVYLFFSALLGATVTQYFFFLGIQYTSATFACAFLNAAPVITFLIALPFRLETLNIRSKSGVAKMLGTVVCVTGAMLMTLYKGAALSGNLQQAPADHHSHSVGDSNRAEKWKVGSVALVAGTFTWSSWFLVQSKLSRKYPAIYSCTALMFSLSFILAASFTVATQRSISVWALRKKVEIVTVIYAGIVGSGFGFLAMTWCLKQRGPVFTTAFSPLTQIIVAGIDVTILHGPLYLGSVLGSALVILGLYFLLWGKTKEAPNCEAKQVEETKDVRGQAQIV